MSEMPIFPAESLAASASPYDCKGLIGDLISKYRAMHVKIAPSVRKTRCTDIIADRPFKLVWQNINGVVEEKALSTDNDWRYTFQGVALKLTDKCYFDLVFVDRRDL